jgi:hypothetical protein
MAHLTISRTSETVNSISPEGKGLFYLIGEKSGLGVLTAVAITIKRAREALYEYNRKVDTTEAIGDYEAVRTARKAYIEANAPVPAELVHDKDASVIALHEHLKAKAANPPQPVDIEKLRGRGLNVSREGDKAFALRLSLWQKLKYVIRRVFHEEASPSFRLVLNREREKGLLPKIEKPGNPG